MALRCPPGSYPDRPHRDALSRSAAGEMPHTIPGLLLCLHGELGYPYFFHDLAADSVLVRIYRPGESVRVLSKRLVVGS